MMHLKNKEGGVCGQGAAAVAAVAVAAGLVPTRQRMKERVSQLYRPFIIGK